EETINKLLDLLLHEERNESSLSHVINVLLTLLSPKANMPVPPAQQQLQQQQQQPQLLQEQQGLRQSPSVESSDSESSENQKNVVARTIAKRLPSLHNILLHTPK
ncbi:hypothetical protein SK128_026291, partial [Halocaridina rubra]